MKFIFLLLFLITSQSCAIHKGFVMNLRREKNKLKFEECSLYINEFTGNSEVQNCENKEIKLD